MKNRYGQLPKPIGQYNVQLTEMMFYQDMPIKLKGMVGITLEPRIFPFEEIINKCIDDFIKEYGTTKFLNSYVYISAKHLFQDKNKSFNRPGWHSDGFMSNDVNYIWSDKNPTVFNYSEFTLTQNDSISIQEMEQQAKPENDFFYPEYSLLRLDQYNIHRVADVNEAGMRKFLKASFSVDKYDLKGNAHNYNLNYKWDLKDRNVTRNIPQSKL